MGVIVIMFKSTLLLVFIWELLFIARHFLLFTTWWGLERLIVTITIKYDEYRLLQFQTSKSL